MRARDLCYRELMESIRIPPGGEVRWAISTPGLPECAALVWQSTLSQAFEGIRLGLAAPAEGMLAREPGAGQAP